MDVVLKGVIAKAKAPSLKGVFAFVQIGSELAEVRVISVAEGWAMVRRKGCMPFVVRATELKARGATP